MHNLEYMGFFVKGNVENYVNASQPDFACPHNKDVRIINEVMNKFQIACLGNMQKLSVKIAFLISLVSSQCIV